LGALKLRLSFLGVETVELDGAASAVRVGTARRGSRIDKERAGRDFE
jgi:hypothetical protein